jgi:formiminoglutamate deiminase
VAVTAYFCDAAFLGAGSAVAGVLVTVDGPRIASVEVGTGCPPGAVHLRGLTLPGFANAHSHAFHRLLRGRTERPGTFWAWRDQMYAVASVLDPDRFHRVARAAFAEMALAGFTAVGEFHYLHHPPGGGRYADPNVMGAAAFQAAADAGVRLTLLDTCYLQGAPGAPLEGAQRRFGDESADAWAERVEALRPPAGDAALSAGGPGDGQVGGPGDGRVGAAIHSVRAVPPGGCATVAAWAAGHGVPLHVHLSEQPAENDMVAAAYGGSPTGILSAAGALGPSSTAVHATHLTQGDLVTLGGTGTGVCMCPTTERSLGDGIGPAAALAAVGVPLSLGSDSQAVIDPLEEARTLELDQRQASGRRGHFSAAQLLAAAAEGGHRAIGWDGAGRIAPGAWADLVTISMDSPRLAGADPGCLLELAVFSAGSQDVTDVVVSGRPVVSGGHHLLVPDVAGALRSAMAEVAEAMAER